MTTTGPLAGLRVLELAGLAPAPFAATILSDLGAEVLRLDRADQTPGDLPGELPAPPSEPLGRGRRSVAVDLKHPEAAATVLRLAERADVFIEGFRPGVCERLGIGPDACQERNPALIYVRITGWGQNGPLADRAGHDIDYLALSGALEPMGPVDASPVPPVNYVADFGGGGMLGVVGVLAALHERERSGRGQVIDAAMVEGAALMSAHLHGLRAQGLWTRQRGANLFNGAAPFYRTYTCADGRFVAVGAVEAKFYAQLLTGLGLADAELPGQYDREHWPSLAQRFAAVFATRTRAEWEETFAGTDACVVPVLSPDEAASHPHLVERGSFVDVAGMTQPAPAPRFSRTVVGVPGGAPYPGEHTAEALADWGLSDAEVAALTDAGAVRAT